MKGYTEECGMEFKLGFDAETKQFSNVQVTHGFLATTENIGGVQQYVGLPNRLPNKKRRRRIATQPANPERKTGQFYGRAEFVVSL